MRVGVILLLVLGLVGGAFARSNYTGYSGSPNRQSCAYSCHGGNNNGTVSISGFPATYTPGTSYTITITRASGSSINNFNASCRIGTGTVNAGTLSAGTGTSTYNVSGETNGIHLSSNNQTSATFNWLAPAAGTGTVVLYVAAHQGSSAGGANTEIATSADELVVAPGVASNPTPANGATAVALNAPLTWTAGAGATSHRVYFGTSNPPALIGNQAGASYQPAGGLQPGSTYYWQIDEVNGAGPTTGPVWSFSTQAEPGAANAPSPANNATGVIPTVQLSWTAGAGATGHDVSFGNSNPPSSQGTITETSFDPADDLLPNTVYYWQIDERIGSLLTPGTLWTFTTLALPDTAHNPVPADGATNVSLVTAMSWSPVALADSYQVFWGLTNPPETELFTTDTLFAISGFLRSDTTYYWRVNTINAAGTVEGPLWSFRTEVVNATPPSRPTLVKDAALGLVYPNPFNAVVTVPFSLPKSADVQLALYDVTGRQVAVLAQGTYGPGEHRIEWSSDGFATGVYLLRLTTGKKVLTTKITAIK